METYFTDYCQWHCIVSITFLSNYLSRLAFSHVCIYYILCMYAIVHIASQSQPIRNTLLSEVYFPLCVIGDECDRYDYCTCIGYNYVISTDEQRVIGVLLDCLFTIKLLEIQQYKFLSIRISYRTANSFQLRMRLCVRNVLYLVCILCGEEWWQNKTFKALFDRFSFSIVNVSSLFPLSLFYCLTPIVLIPLLQFLFVLLV